MSRIMARLYHVLVSMIYGHDTGVASPGRDGANNLYLYFYIMISLCIYFVCRFNFLVFIPCVSSTIAAERVATLCVDSQVDPAIHRTPHIT